MALPKLSFRTTTGGEVTTHDFGSVDAGNFTPDSSGWEVRLYNDYDADGRDTATSIRVNVRGSTGGFDETWCEQHWVEIKSNGYSTGSTGMTDDAMTVFQPVGKDAPLSVGDITSTGYRTLFVRVNAPTNAQEQNISLQLVATYQDPQTAITKWITGIRGNGVIPTTGEPLQISTGSIGSELVYKDGYALIDNNEIYYGSSGTYDIETTGSGAYKIYLDEAGSFGETTGTLASNQLALAEITVSSGTCTTGSVVDKRVFLPGIQAGTTGARPTTPNKTGDMYFDITNAALYGAKTSTAWTLITSTIPGSSGGEANTASNENTTGVGVFWQKDGVNLEFKGIHSTGNISVTDATGTHTVNIDVITTGITLNDLDTPYAVTTGDVMSFGAHSAGFTEQSSTATTGTATIDWSNGNKALYTRSTGAGGACTIAFTDPPKSMSVMLIIRGSTAGSSGAISWSTGNIIYWSSTATPSFSTGASAIDVVGLYYSTGLGGYLAMGTTNFSTV